MNIHDLPKHLRDLVAKTGMRKARKPRPIEQTTANLLVQMFLPCDPPTVTHHHKMLARGRLIDKPELRAAKSLLRAIIPPNKGPAVAPPVMMDVTAYFLTYSDGPEVEWMSEKPDCDNFSKLVTDTLARAGWLIDDKHVARVTIGKVLVRRPVAKLNDFHHQSGFEIILGTAIGAPPSPSIGKAPRVNIMPQKGRK